MGNNINTLKTLIVVILYNKDIAFPFNGFFY